MNNLELKCVKKRRVSCAAARLHGGFLAVSLCLLSCGVYRVGGQTQTYTSTGTITISNGVAASTPYPSLIYVGTNGASSLPGIVQTLSIRLNSLNCQAPGDLGFMLVAPNGTAYEFMSFAGSTTTSFFLGSLIITDGASELPFNMFLSPGTYAPTSYDNEVISPGPYPAPAPQTFNSAAPYGTSTFISTFDGVAPNGNWELFMANRLLGSSGTLGSWAVTFTVFPPDLSITCFHTGSFCQGQTAQYTLTVRNEFQGHGAQGSTGGDVAATVVDTLPAGLTPIAASGSTWNCAINGQTLTCTQTNPILAGTSYPPITVTVNVASNAPASVVNAATVSGSLDNTPGNDTSSDPTTISPVPVATITTPTMPPIVCPNSTGNQASGPVNATTFSWTITNGVITSATNLQTITYTAGPSGNVGLTLRAGNAAGCTATNSLDAPILVDATPPTITCSSNITVTAFGNCPAIVNFNVSASDNCTLSSLVATPASGSAFPVGTNTVTVVATDGSGNTNTCNFKVTVLPGPPPRLAAFLAGTNVVISWPAAAGCYALQYRPALLSPPVSNLWTSYAGPLVTNGGSIVMTNSAPVASRFYRLVY